MSEADSIVNDFLTESRENLDRLDQDLVALENNPHDTERLARIFRTVHNIKGTCGFLGLTKLGQVAHAGETLLARLRDRQLTLTPETAGVLLALVDALRALLAHIQSTGREADTDYAGLIARLNLLQRAKPPESPEPPEEGAEPDLPAAQDADAAGPDDRIRVAVGLLDRLVTLVGELVLARNQVLELAGGQTESGLATTFQRLSRITSELQEAVLKTRMQPVAKVWNQFPRLVRDLALACGKQVRIDRDGDETEMDRSILEAVKDPLTHLVRNAVDHGIELPARRRERGKPAEGRVMLRARHEGGHVILEVADDGGGIDPARIRQKAIEGAFLTPHQADGMSERELVQLIFLPGFTTAAQVTSVSGRGVGMDVVKTNIEKLGGTIDVDSRPGEGTSFRLKIPLTLAIIPALLVTAGGDRYAIPQVSLRELVRLEGERAGREIEFVHGAPVYRLRGDLLPLVYLERLLEIGPVPPREIVNLVVLQAGERPFGLVVDGIHDTEDVVVKPLSRQLKGIPVYAGATILGDGRVALILDVPGIARTAGLQTETARTPVAAGTSAAPSRPTERRQALVLLGVGRDRRLAVPLARVVRLEQIAAGAVEQAAGREVVQYRGRILPLVRLPGADGGQDPLQVVVCSARGGSVGVVTDRILDVLETAVTLETSGPHDGLLGSAVIRDKITDLLDLDAFLGHDHTGGGTPA
jgi:two-component system chemotaxis sensor kinase CheA